MEQVGNSVNRVSGIHLIADQDHMGAIIDQIEHVRDSHARQADQSQSQGRQQGGGDQQSSDQQGGEQQGSERRRRPLL